MTALDDWRERVRAAADLPVAERLDTYEEACQAFPSDAEFQAWLVSEILYEDRERARAVARDALSLEIEDPEIAYALAESLFHLEEYDDSRRAIRILRQAAGEDLRTELAGRMFLLLARLAGANGDSDQMLEGLDAAVQCEPDNVLYVLSHAAMLTELERVPEALAVMEAGLKHSPDDESLIEEIERLKTS